MGLTLTELIRLCIAEDIPEGDITTEALFDESHKCRAEILAGQAGILSGIELAKHVFLTLDSAIVFEKLAEDGEKVAEGTKIALVYGKTRSILAGERLALNFLMRMSGIATATHDLQEKLKEKGVKIRITDTRKTTPLWRFAEKKAVRDGGGINHRMSLSDAVLIKDNHIALVGSIGEAVKRAKENLPAGTPIEVEVSSLTQIRGLLILDVEAILLDNFTPDEVKEAVRIIDGKAKVEVSGGITPENIEDYAIEGVDVISVGWLTHSAPALNFSLEIIDK